MIKDLDPADVTITSLSKDLENQVVLRFSLRTHSLLALRLIEAQAEWDDSIGVLTPFRCVECDSVTACSPSCPEDDSAPPIGIIAGVVVGVLLIVGGTIIFVVVRRRRRQMISPPPSAPPARYPQPLPYV